MLEQPEEWEAAYFRFECRIAIRNRSYIENASFRGGRPTGRPDTDRRGEAGSPDLYGKSAGRNLTCRERCQVPVIALGGAVEATEALNRMGFTAVLPIQPFPVTLEEAMQPEFTKENIERTVRQVVRIIKQFTK